MLTENRTKTGRFPTGISGNYNGRPKKTDEEREVDELLRLDAPTNFRKLIAKRDDPDTSDDLQVKIMFKLLDKVAGDAARELIASITHHEAPDLSDMDDATAEDLAAMFAAMIGEQAMPRRPMRTIEHRPQREVTIEDLQRMAVEEEIEERQELRQARRQRVSRPPARQRVTRPRS